MFERKSYARLLDWKESSDGTTALLVEGARRVGKTTLTKQFAEQEYADFIYVDFSNTGKDLLDLFRDYRGDIDTFLRMLQLYFSKELPRRNAVIIFDEVQRFPPAREMIKHLVADGRFDYIETGSLISIKKNVQDILIPSEEERLSLWPLDFEEYLWALQKKILADEIRRACLAQTPLPAAIHRQCERLFNEYMLVGGMPQAVAAFIEDADFARCDKVKRRILALYVEDMAKFGGLDGRKAYAIFQEIPGQLSAGSKRFKFTTLGKSARYREYDSALMWLADARVATVCRKCNDPNVGYRLTADESALKCYMADTGLLMSHAFADGKEALEIYRAIQFGRVSVNKGMIVENVIAQQLTAAGDELFYYAWDEPAPGDGKSRHRPREIDFLITRAFADAAGKPRVCPIEVKSSKSYSTVSLDAFRKHFGKRMGDEIIFHPKQLKREGQRLYLPLYMSFCL